MTDRRTNVLLVERTPSSGAMTRLREILNELPPPRASRFQLTQVKSTEEAEEWLGSQNLGVIVVDDAGPDGRSLTPLKAFRSIAPATPVIVLCDAPDESRWIRQLFQAGAYRCLTGQDLTPALVEHTIHAAARNSPGSGRDLLGPQGEALNSKSS